MSPESQDPTVIRSLAVSPTDVVDAFVYTQENPGTAVLRVTPPFHGRMRARLHVYHIDDTRLTGAVHLEPAATLEPSVVEAYPTVPAGTGTAPTEARNRHADAVERWRERAQDAIRASTTVEVGEEEHTVELVSLG